MNINLSPDRWRVELDLFSRQYEGWIVSLSTRDTNGTVAVEAQDVPLRGISQDSPQSKRIVIDIGRPGAHLSHEVDDVRKVTIDLTADRATRALVLEAGDGTTTTVAFRSPTRPEEVDGLPMAHR